MPPNTPTMPDFEALTKDLFNQIAQHVAGQAISHFKGSFRKQGFTDSSFIPWPQRRDDAGHKLLRLSNTLMDSITPASVTSERVVISAGEGVPYAAIHNNGGVIRVQVTKKMRKYFWYLYKQTGQEHWKYMALTKKQALTIKIPQRQYIGNSETLNKNIDEAIVTTIDNNYKKIFQQ